MFINRHTTCQAYNEFQSETVASRLSSKFEKKGLGTIRFLLVRIRAEELRLILIERGLSGTFGYDFCTSFSWKTRNQVGSVCNFSLSDHILIFTLVMLRLSART